MKIEHSKYVDYTLVVPGFTVRMSDYDKIRKCFNWRKQGMLFGNKYDGTQTLIDSKE